MEKKLVVKAFNKLQKREHLLRVTRDRFALGRITEAAYRTETAAIIEKYKLTLDEWRAYDKHCKMYARKKS